MSDGPLPSGIVTPLVAFVTPQGEPDAAAMKALVDSQVTAGVAAVLINGSMGEIGLLTPAQREGLLATVVEAAAGRVSVWCGVGALSTPETAGHAADAGAGGADAVLALTPLYHELGDLEIRRHYETVAAASSVPLLAYDIPQRTPRKIPPAVIAALAADGVLHGVKDSSGDLTQGRVVCLQTADIDGFRCYAGTDLAIDAVPALGFVGSVPGLANVLPEVAVAIDTAARAGDPITAARQQRAFLELMTLVQIPLPGGGPSSVAFDSIKAATAHVLGLGEPVTLPPLTPPDNAYLAAVSATVARARALANP